MTKDRAVLRPKDGSHNGGEHHQVSFVMVDDWNLEVQVEADCHGTHSSSFSMHMPLIEPDDVEKFGIALVRLADEMREKRTQRHVQVSA